jgi:hypothetical protein
MQHLFLPFSQNFRKNARIYNLLIFRRQKRTGLRPDPRKKTFLQEGFLDFPRTFKRQKLRFWPSRLTKSPLARNEVSGLSKFLGSRGVFSKTPLAGRGGGAPQSPTPQI